MAAFVGRQEELTRLTRALDRVRSRTRTEEPGTCLLVHGRRRVGKSRLVERFLETAGVPAVFFTASRQLNEPTLFLEDVAESPLPAAGTVGGVAADSWEVALRLLDAVLPADEPSIVVIDEFPYLLENDLSIESTFQKHWDRTLKKKPVLLLLVGSDIAVMEALNDHSRAFHQRGTPFPVGPLSPAETASIVQSPDAASAFDVYLITGGLPLLCDEWPPGLDMWDYLGEALNEPTSALVVTADLALAAEFPADVQARTVLTQIGTGETTFTNIQKAAGGLQPTSLKRSLEHLVDKRVVAKDLPLSTKTSSESRYRVADPSLRFWLRFIGPNRSKIDRGRGDLVLADIRKSYTDWRGRAIEPVVREALARTALANQLPAPADEIGGYWTRNNHPEVDIVGADRRTPAKSIGFVGSIKWFENKAVSQAELTELSAVAGLIPGADASTPLVLVARGAVTARGAAATFGPDDLLAAWS